MVQVREITDREREYWDREIQGFEFVHPLNCYGWGLVRSVDKWSPTYLVAERHGRFCGGLMLLQKRLPFTPFSILYGPRGPVWNYSDDESLVKLIEKVKKIAKKKRAIFLRVDPSIPENIIKTKGDRLSPFGFIHLDKRWNFWNTPRDVSRIDLRSTDSAEDLFGKLHRDTRRCIRKAYREGGQYTRVFFCTQKGGHTRYRHKV